MPIMSENPCADGHPELRLLIEVTTFSDRLPVMHCRRCGENLSFEDAVRNDERIKLAKPSPRVLAYVVRDPNTGAETGYPPEAVRIVHEDQSVFTVQHGSVIETWELKS
jgi:hypothetical protein